MGVMAQLLGSVASSISKTTTASSDPYASSVIALFPYQADMFDKSGSRVASINNGCSIETGTGPFSGNCVLCGAGSFLTVLLNAQFLTSDFTIEGWVKTTNGSGAFTVEARNKDDFAMFTMAGSGLYASSNGTSWNVLSNAGSPNMLTSGAWIHFAIVRNGTNLAMWINGASVSSTTLAAGFSWPQKGALLYLGKSSVDTANGSIHRFAHLRITKGVARYTAAFTPPTAAFPAVFAPASPRLYTVRRVVVPNAVNARLHTVRRFTVLK